MFRVRVLATQKEIALITTARRRGLTALQFIARVVKTLAKKHVSSKMAHHMLTSPKHHESATETEISIDISLLRRPRCEHPRC